MKLIRKKGKVTLYDETLDSTVGLLNLPTWYNSNAVIKIAEDEFILSKKSIWTCNYLVQKNGLEIGEIYTNWKGKTTIDLGDESQQYPFYAKGVLKTRFEIYDPESILVLTLRVSSKWHKLKPDFDVEYSSSPNGINILLLTMLSAFCSVLHQQRVGAVAAS